MELCEKNDEETMKNEKKVDLASFDDLHCRFGRGAVGRAQVGRGSRGGPFRRSLGYWAAMAKRWGVKTQMTVVINPLLG